MTLRKIWHYNMKSILKYEIVYFEHVSNCLNTSKIIKNIIYFSLPVGWEIALMFTWRKVKENCFDNKVTEKFIFVGINRLRLRVQNLMLFKYQFKFILYKMRFSSYGMFKLTCYCLNINLLCLYIQAMFGIYACWNFKFYYFNNFFIKYLLF